VIRYERLSIVDMYTETAACDAGFFGENCSLACHCVNADVCEEIGCLDYQCDMGWHGAPACQIRMYTQTPSQCADGIMAAVTLCCLSLADNSQCAVKAKFHTLSGSNLLRTSSEPNSVMEFGAEPASSC